MTRSAERSEERDYPRVEPRGAGSELAERISGPRSSNSPTTAQALRRNSSELSFITDHAPLLAGAHLDTVWCLTGAPDSELGLRLLEGRAADGKGKWIGPQRFGPERELRP